MEASPKTSLSRADFLAAAGSGQKAINPAFLVQFRSTGLGMVRFGLTVTKKHGNAVIRNKIKRRLREAVRVTLRETALPNGDYVVIARNEALTAEFNTLLTFTRQAFSRIHKPKPLV
ncbi:MAG: ribonuclease P protein component [Rickettsiales bacterium]